MLTSLYKNVKITMYDILYKEYIMKKILSFTLIALSLVMVFCLFSCDKEEVPSNDVEICLEGTHEYLAWEIEKDAVCNSKGIRTRTCVICKQYTEKQYFTKSDNHNFVDLVCTYCGKHIPSFRRQARQRHWHSVREYSSRTHYALLLLQGRHCRILHPRELQS